jgi:four helix bundle protein
VADRLEDLVAWQLADELRKEVYELFSNGRAAKDMRLRSEGEDAASSVCRNLAEGFHRFSPAEFARFARYSASSIGEVGAVLGDGVAKQHWTPEQVARAQSLVKRTRSAVGRLQRYLRSKRARKNAESILRRAEAPNRAEPEH